MATLEEILAMSAAAGDSDALAALQSNNIGYQLSGVGSSIAELVGKTALQDALANKPVDLKGAAIASALGGLIGGISKGYGNRVLTQEYDDYKNAVTELAAGRPVDESKIGSTVFNLAKNKADIFRAARAADIEKRRNAILDAGLQAGTVERAKATAFDPTLSLVANMDAEQLASLRQKLGPEGAALIDANLNKLAAMSPSSQLER
ncbi:hypothetical protein KC976_04535, partial [Candidatus Saccharibacteria bacterium]|nr:hypothetical protein [Candidatus Saccharibacteria bacterium]